MRLSCGLSLAFVHEEQNTLQQAIVIQSHFSALVSLKTSFTFVQACMFDKEIIQLLHLYEDYVQRTMRPQIVFINCFVIIKEIVENVLK